VDNVVNLYASLFKGLFLLLSGGVCTCSGLIVNLILMRRVGIHVTNINIGTGLEGDHGAVNLVDDIVDQFSDLPNMNDSRTKGQI
jgi:hypothetical protein